MADNIAIYPYPTDHPSRIYCVYAISGTYGLLPRILYYTTLVFAIFGRQREWLVIGALVSALTYAGTAAIHAMTLTTSKTPIFDLDVYGAWSILSVGALAYVAMVHWSTTLKNSRARIVLVAWGILVGLGVVFGRVMLFDTPLHPLDGEAACYSATGRLLQYPIELLSREYNCTYSCFAPNLTTPLRQPSEVMAVPLSILKSKISRLGLVTVGPIMFASSVSISFDTREHTPSQLCMRVVMKYMDPKANHEDIHRLIYTASMERWYGGYFVLWSFYRHKKWGPMKVVMTFLTLPWVALELAIDLLCLPLLILTVALNELMILGNGGLPTNEANYAIGQWGPVVGSALVIVAALINQYLEEKDRRLKRKDIPREADEEQISKSGESDIELGLGHPSDNEQTSGVVVPKMVHVQTLREADEILWVRPKR